jgi:phosphosulfolactate synthase (CoM biosynthesis protein A)
MFEAADPDVFGWYNKNYGVDVNLFVDHSRIVQWNAFEPAFGERKICGEGS